jgi:hypothetical protein
MSGLEDLGISTLDHRGQIVRVIEDHLRSLKDHLGEMPRSRDPLNGAVYVAWERRAMTWVGRLTGVLELAQLTGLLTPEQFQRLKHQGMAAITHLTAEVVMHGRDQ